MKYNIRFQRGPNRYGFLPGDKLSFLAAGVCLLMSTFSAAICFDFDLSYDHDPPGIMSQALAFIDNTHLRITLIKFGNQSLILFAINKFHFFNRAPPA